MEQGFTIGVENRPGRAPGKPASRRPAPDHLRPWILVGAALLAGVVLARVLVRRANGDD
jgi:hypothetical protein